MSRDTLLLVLTAAGSALCWWPALIEPSVDLPGWVLFVLVAVITGLSAMLSTGRWLWCVIASAAGVCVGLQTGVFIFPPSDGIARSYAPLVSAMFSLASIPVAFLGGLVGRSLSTSRQDLRRALWIAFFLCVAFGPAALALTPPLVAHRIAVNDRLVADRFAALKNAVEQTFAEGGNPTSICGGQNLRRHYFGPPFSDEDWDRITGNYVKQDGYVFMVYCREGDGYKIDAWPARGKADGTRRFCTDKSGKIGCGMGSNHVCIACPK